MQTFKKNSYCSFCGTQFLAAQTYPKRCSNCQNTTYINPLPVAVVLVSVGTSVLLIRRNIEPQKGKLALPGGFLEVNESWQEGGAREVKEETGLDISPKEIELFEVESTADGNVLIFGLWKGNSGILDIEFAQNSEVTELQWINPADKINFAFPLHEKVVNLFWK